MCLSLLIKTQVMWVRAHSNDLIPSRPAQHSYPIPPVGKLKWRMTPTTKVRARSSLRAHLALCSQCPKCHTCESSLSKTHRFHVQIHTDTFGKEATWVVVFSSATYWSILPTHFMPRPAKGFTPKAAISFKCVALFSSIAAQLALLMRPWGASSPVPMQLSPWLLIATQHQSFRALITICSISLFSTPWALCSETRYFFLSGCSSF